MGEVHDDAKSEFLGRAKALLFPIEWPEPFGLVMIEAMACGTPVIALQSGSVPEIASHGVTGFIIRNEDDDALSAITRIEEIDRRQVRAEFERRFSVRKMAQQYLRCYTDLLSRGSAGRPSRGIRPASSPALQAAAAKRPPSTRRRPEAGSLPSGQAPGRGTPSRPVPVVRSVTTRTVRTVTKWPSQRRNW